MTRATTFLKHLAENMGYLLVYLFHITFLFFIGGVIIWASWITFWQMVAKGHPSIDDILLLFIYLELGAMVGIYFATNRMPVNFLIYVVITALTRHEIGILGAEHHKANIDMLIVPAAIVLLTFSVVLLKLSRAKFLEPSPERIIKNNVFGETSKEKMEHSKIDSSH